MGDALRQWCCRRKLDDVVTHLMLGNGFDHQAWAEERPLIVADIERRQHEARVRKALGEDKPLDPPSLGSRDTTSNPAVTGIDDAVRTYVRHQIKIVAEVVGEEVGRREKQLAVDTNAKVATATAE